MMKCMKSAEKKQTHLIKVKNNFFLRGHIQDNFLQNSNATFHRGKRNLAAGERAEQTIGPEIQIGLRERMFSFWTNRRGLHKFYEKTVKPPFKNNFDKMSKFLSVRSRH